MPAIIDYSNFDATDIEQIWGKVYQKLAYEAQLGYYIVRLQFELREIKWQNLTPWFNF